jgi:GAF domain-containing protein
MTSPDTFGKSTSGSADGRSVWQRLVEPGNSVKTLEDRHQARLLASILVILAPLTATGSVYTLMFAAVVAQVVVWTLGLVALVLVALYFLSRTRYYRLSAWIMIATLLAVPFVIAILQESGSASLGAPFIWSALPILLSSALLPLWAVAVLGAANVIGLLLLPLVASYGGLVDLVQPLSLTAGMFALTLSLARYRDMMEQDRQAALSDRNRELQAIRESLEQQVSERTMRLERRARYLQATSAVAREAASMLGEPQALLSKTVHLISEQFGFYHAGLFLLSAGGEWAELQAASSEGGQRMLARGHRLRVGEQGIVGYVAGRGEPRVALDVGDDATFFNSPDLSRTRSEMALPLWAHGEIIGVMDVQSTEPGAFAGEDVSVLQSLADQVAVAIGNARLFLQAEENAESERRARGDLSREAWAQLLRSEPDLSFVDRRGSISPAAGLWRAEMAEAMRTASVAASKEDETRLAVPLRISGEVVGVLDGVKRRDGGAWTSDEISMLETLAEQLGSAVERARLYRETQHNAARERTIAEVGAQMRASLDIEAMLRTAASEMRQALDLGDLVIRLASPEVKDQAPVEGGE